MPSVLPAYFQTCGGPTATATSVSEAVDSRVRDMSHFEDHEVVYFEEVVQLVKEADVTGVSEHDLLRLNDKELMVLKTVLSDRKQYQLTDLDCSPSKWSHQEANRWFAAIFNKFRTNSKFNHIASIATDILLKQVMLTYLSVSLITKTADELGQIFNHIALGTAIFKEIQNFERVANGFRELKSSITIKEEESAPTSSSDMYSFPTFFSPHDVLDGPRLLNSQMHFRSMAEFEKFRDVHLLMLRNRKMFPQETRHFEHLAKTDPRGLLQLGEPSGGLRPELAEELKQLVLKRKSEERKLRLNSCDHSLRRKQDPKSKVEKRPNRGKRESLLWQFIMNELVLVQGSHKYIYWLDKSTGSFEISDSLELAKKWGQTKGNENMTYEKMSRSMRQYYREDKSGIIQKTAEGRRLVYRFNLQHESVQLYISALELQNPQLVREMKTFRIT